MILTGALAKVLRSNSIELLSDQNCILDPFYVDLQISISSTSLTQFITIVLGAYSLSPIPSIYAEAGEPSLEQLGQKLSLDNFFFK